MSTAGRTAAATGSRAAAAPGEDDVHGVATEKAPPADGAKPPVDAAAVPAPAQSKGPNATDAMAAAAAARAKDLGASALKAAAPAPPGIRHTVWSFGVSGARQSLKSGNDNAVLGDSAAVQIGTGYISESWYILASFDILLGPYEPTFGRQLDVDFLGTGETIWAGFSAQAANLRSPAGGYGFALGLSYADVVGRSIGKNHADDGKDSPADRALPRDYVMSVTDLSLLPAIFFSWLAPPRPAGNTPELLMTRIEGYILTLGAAMPLSATYTVKYTVPGPKVDPANPGAAPDPTVTDRGTLHGYSVFVNLTALLGS